jgi:hypothetical protein
MATKKTDTKAKTVKKKSVAGAKESTGEKAKKKVATKKVAPKVTTETSQGDESSRVRGTINRSLKLKPSEKEIHIAFYAPLAEKVHVVGTFNKWDASKGVMTKEENGTWHAALALKPGRYEYRFFIDGRWENAQHEHEMVYNEHGSMNSILIV